MQRRVGARPALPIAFAPAVRRSALRCFAATAYTAFAWQPYEAAAEGPNIFADDAATPRCYFYLPQRMRVLFAAQR